jgi:hypothetical protein
MLRQPFLPTLAASLAEGPTASGCCPSPRAEEVAHRCPVCGAAGTVYCVLGARATSFVKVACDVCGHRWVEREP